MLGRATKSGREAADFSPATFRLGTALKSLNFGSQKGLRQSRGGRPTPVLFDSSA